MVEPSPKGGYAEVGDDRDLPWCQCCEADGTHVHDDTTCEHPCCPDRDDDD